MVDLGNSRQLEGEPHALTSTSRGGTRCVGTAFLFIADAESYVPSGTRKVTI
jgi:hypothetical protein